MIIDVLLIGLLIARPSLGLAAWIVVLIAIRHTPMLADEAARMLRIEAYHGLTRALARVALPAWSPMSSELDTARKKSAAGGTCTGTQYDRFA